jgi:hypothetical protein
MKDSDFSPEQNLSELQERSKTLLAKFEELRGFL